MFIWHIILAIFLSTYQKLLKLIEISRSSDRNNFAQFFLRHGVDIDTILYNRYECMYACTYICLNVCTCMYLFVCVYLLTSEYISA